MTEIVEEALLSEDVLRGVGQFLTVKEVVLVVGVLDKARNCLLPKVLSREWLIHLSYLHDRVQLEEITPFPPTAYVFIPSDAELGHSLVCPLISICWNDNNRR